MNRVAEFRQSLEGLQAQKTHEEGQGEIERPHEGHVHSDLLIEIHPGSQGETGGHHCGAKRHGGQHEAESDPPPESSLRHQCRDQVAGGDSNEKVLHKWRSQILKIMRVGGADDRPHKDCQHRNQPGEQRRCFVSDLCAIHRSYFNYGLAGCGSVSEIGQDS